MSAVDDQVQVEEEEETEDDQDAIDAMNGQSIDDRADAGEDEEAVPLTQVPIPGLDPKLTLSVGGTLPTRSEVSIMGASRPVEGQFKKGDMVRLTITARVADISFPDTLDANGAVQSTARRHKMRPISIEILDD